MNTIDRINTDLSKERIILGIAHEEAWTEKDIQEIKDKIDRLSKEREDLGKWFDQLDTLFNDFADRDIEGEDWKWKNRDNPIRTEAREFLFSMEEAEQNNAICAYLKYRFLGPEAMEAGRYYSDVDYFIYFINYKI